MEQRRPVLIVGGSGQIGQHLAEAFRAAGQPVVSTWCRNEQPGQYQLDATDRNRVMQLVAELKPAWSVNSVNAQGGTDACEADPDLATRAHVETARNLVDASRAVGAGLIQISTDYVFDGHAGPYGETDPPAPLSRLGHAKWLAEQYALEQVPEALVVRTSFVFSWAPLVRTKNFVMQVLDHQARRRPMRVPTDQVSNVTYAANFADALVELVALGARGIYHLAGRTRCSKYDWAVRVVDFFQLDRGLIEGVPTAALGQQGPRPLQAGLQLEKAQALLRRTRLWSLEEGLADMERQMACATDRGAVT